MSLQKINMELKLYCFICKNLSLFGGLNEKTERTISMDKKNDKWN